MFIENLNETKAMEVNESLKIEISSPISSKQKKHQDFLTPDSNEHKNSENSFKCSVTDKLFGDSSAEIDLIIKGYLDARNESIHSDDVKGILNQNNKCPQCDYATACLRNLRRHLDEVHEKKKPYKCEKCNYTASRASDLKRHVDAVHEGKKPYKCPNCDFSASQVIHIRRHVNVVHEGKKPFKCQKCDYSSAQASYLRHHELAVHEGKKPHKCEKCDYTASRISDLQKHVDAVHEGKKPYKCQKCDYMAAQTTHLRQHINAVHEGKKPYKCQKCDYATSRKSDLRKHIDAVHEGKKPYICPKCDYKASRISHLREHVDAMHRKKSQQNSRSNNRTIQASNPPKHTKAVHKKSKYFKCCKCDYKASRISDLREHIYAMHGKKPQQNLHSDNRTIRTSYLQKHTKGVHKKTKYFKCCKCEFKTSWSSHLQRHVNAVHSKKKEMPICVTIKSENIDQ